MKFRKRASLYLSLCIYGCTVTIASLSYGFDEKRLWLPVKYQNLYVDMKKAAEVAEQQESCKELLKGTLDRDQSTSELPVFRFLCRREDGVTYNQMIYGMEPKIATPQELEQLEMLYRERCLNAYEKATALMLQKKALFENTLKPDIMEEEMAVFVLDFDARSVQGVPLRYRARCSTGIKMEPTVEISPRK